MVFHSREHDIFEVGCKVSSMLMTTVVAIITLGEELMIYGHSQHVLMLLEIMLCKNICHVYLCSQVCFLKTIFVRFFVNWTSMDIMFVLEIQFNYTCDSCNCLICNSFWCANIFNEHDKCTYGYVAYVVERLVI